jgi:hypothetical protein
VTELLEEIRALLRQADAALSRQLLSGRTPRQRDEDFDEALRAHRHAVAILEVVHQQPTIAEALVTELAPIQVEIADMEILISEIRFDESERTERLPRLRHVAG